MENLDKIEEEIHSFSNIEYNSIEVCKKIYNRIEELRKQIDYYNNIYLDKLLNIHLFILNNKLDYLVRKGSINDKYITGNLFKKNISE